MDFLKNKAKLFDQNEFTRSVHSITVPGAAAAWVDTVHHFGSGKVDLSTIFAPAIDLAENGYYTHLFFTKHFYLLFFFKKKAFLYHIYLLLQ